MRPSRARRALYSILGTLGLVIVVLLGLILTGAFSTSEPSPGAGPDPGMTVAPATPAETSSPVPVTAASTSATKLLAALPIKGRAPMTGYARVADFGPAWKDVDQNGCDTRNDILARDLTSITQSGRCKVLSGTLISPYTGQVIHFVRGVRTSTLIQIDHMVALGDAWQTGAQKLTLVQRTALANDPLNLMAVDGRSNDQKGDGDAATWLPSNKSFRCTYVEHQVDVKAKYGLWVTAPEHDAIARVLAKC